MFVSCSDGRTFVCCAHIELLQCIITCPWLPDFSEAEVLLSSLFLKLDHVKVLYLPTSPGTEVLQLFWGNTEDIEEDIAQSVLQP